MNGIKSFLSEYDQIYRNARKTIQIISDENKSDEEWSFLNSGQVLFSHPKAAVVHNFVLNHLIHHTALSELYLRLNDIPAPAIFGPSADEQIM